ncbi:MULTISPECIES: hypothetical protein [Nocardiopsis]|uniref:Uncharacterized protein n=1 Tax=Nocardiopsis sinuspersici TaxID=501010 RepID=A0A1V3BWC2_9ACTN|nr:MULTISPECIES: hypothetical protein [Nocardiopsis]OOC52476.1 hypothetical protein NOSIN_00350 [Nocardiopsis sinuspersici]
MYDDFEPTRDALSDIEDLLTARQHSPRFWDADAAEQVTGADPFEHPSWDVYEALAEDGWDDPAEAIEVRELLADDIRLAPLADTPTGRPRVRPVDAVLVDRPTPEEELHTHLLALVAEIDGEQGVSAWAA